MFALIRSYVPALQTPFVRQASMLARLTPTKDSKNRERRLGRGPGSGLGKTSGRGQKGQKARGSVPNWFEGGQTPLWKLFPKRGFYRFQKLDLHELKLSKIQNFYEQGRLSFLKEGEVLDMKNMKIAGLISGSMKDGVAILNDPLVKYTLNLKIESTKASQPAIEAIENAGGSYTSAYYSRRLGFRAHHSPTWFLENKGKIPLRARPVARRDIVFYSDPKRNGYLQNSEYVNKITVGGSRIEKAVKKTALNLEFEKALENDVKPPVTDSRIISFADLKL